MLIKMIPMIPHNLYVLSPTHPLLWLRISLIQSKVLSWLNTYRLWGIIGIVLMSTFLIHAYFLRSRHFRKSRLFSREISTVRGGYKNPDFINIIVNVIHTRPLGLIQCPGTIYRIRLKYLFSTPQGPYIP